MTTTRSRPSSTARPDAGRSATPPKPAATLDPIRIIRRHLWLLIAVAVIGAVLGAAGHYVDNRWFPRFKGEVIFEIKSTRSDANEIASGDFRNEDGLIRAARTEMKSLLDRRNIEKAVRAKEVKESEWGKQFSDESGQFEVGTAVDELQRELNADMVRNTNLFFLEWKSGHQGDIPTILNNVAKFYLEERKGQVRDEYAETQALFESRQAEFEDQILEKSLQIDNFIHEHGLTAQDTATNQEMDGARDLLQQINDAERGFSMVDAEVRQLEQKLKAGEAAGYSEEERRRAEDDPNIRSMSATLNDLRVALSTARERFEDSHPQVVHYLQMERAAKQEREEAIKARIRRDREARYKEALNFREQYSQTLERQEERYAEMTVKLKDFSAHVQTLKSMKVELSELERRRDDARASIADAEIYRIREIPVHLFKSAEEPRERSNQPRIVLMAMGMLVLGGLTLGIIFLRELLDQRVKSASDLGVIPGAKVLGSVPDIEDDPTGCPGAELAVRASPGSVVAESYRQTNARVVKEMDAGGHVVLVVVGGMPGAGTTTVVTNIGATDAAAGKRVLVIDANFRRPRLAAALGLADEGTGLGDLLAGDAAVDEVIVDGGEGLHLIHAGTPANRILERLNNPRFDSALAELRPRYDVIIVDAPPAVVAGEAMVLASKSDAALLVVRANQEQRGLVARLVHQLADMRCELLGILLNRPRGTAGGYLKKNYAAMAEYSRTD